MTSFLSSLERAIQGKQYGTISILFMQILASETSLKPYVAYLQYMPHYDDNQFTEMLSKEQFHSIGLELLQNHPSYYWRSPYGFDHFYHYNFQPLHNHEIKKCFEPNNVMLWEKHEQFAWDNRLGDLCIDRLLEEFDWDECSMSMLYETLSSHSSKVFDLIDRWDISVDAYRCDVLDWVAYHYGFQKALDYERWYEYTRPCFNLSTEPEDIFFVVDHAPPQLLERWFKEGIFTESLLRILDVESNYGMLQHILARLVYEPTMLSVLHMYSDFTDNALLKSFFFGEHYPEEWSNQEQQHLDWVLSSIATHPTYAVLLHDYHQNRIAERTHVHEWLAKKQHWDKGDIFPQEMSLFLTPLPH